MNTLQANKILLLEQGLQQCSICGEIKPLCEFSKRRDKYRSACKVCTRELYRKQTGYYIKHTPTEEDTRLQSLLTESTKAKNKRLQDTGMGWCSSCKRELPLSEFYTDRASKNRCKLCDYKYKYKGTAQESRFVHNKRLITRGLYWCNCCKHELPIRTFLKNDKGNPIGFCSKCRQKANIILARKRRDIDGIYRMKISITTSFRRAIRGKQLGSASKWIGCSKQFLKDYLASLFTEGMSWDNYGEWHIDHIIPQAYFDFNNPDEVRMCWNYRNLQPLWGHDNVEKGANLPIDLDERLAILRAVCIPVQ